MIPAFQEFNKIPRLNREMIITEKLDGTNAVIYITEENTIYAGSRNRWITPEDDNYGFAKWVKNNEEDLKLLGKGFHYGEWWGQGIQRNYGLKEKRFSLFNVHRWNDILVRPKCCDVVPILYTGLFDTNIINNVLNDLASNGSKAAPGFLKPEGVIIFHEASGRLMKATIEKDEEYKGKSK